MTINRKLKRARIEHDYSQAELGELIGATQSAVAHIERGALRPSPRLARRLAAVLNAGSEELFGPRVDGRRRLR